MSAAELHEPIVDRIERYLESWRDGDLAGRRRLFSPHAVLEDPVGSPPVTGLDRIEAHWTRLAADGAAYEATLRRVVVCGHEALVQYTLRTEPPRGQGSVTEVFATLAFDSALEIRALRCWVDESCLHVLG